MVGPWSGRVAEVAAWSEIWQVAATSEGKWGRDGTERGRMEGRSKAGRKVMYSWAARCKLVTPSSRREVREREREGGACGGALRASMRSQGMHVCSVELYSSTSWSVVPGSRRAAPLGCWMLGGAILQLAGQVQSAMSAAQLLVTRWHPARCTCHAALCP